VTVKEREDGTLASWNRKEYDKAENRPQSIEYPKTGLALSWKTERKSTIALAKAECKNKASGIVLNTPNSK
jgi:hypothetical protein